MRRRQPFVHLVAVTLLATLVATLAACTSGSSQDDQMSHGSDYSRIRFYPSLKSLADDSAVVVNGVVTAQRVAADITPDLDFTISTYRVQGVVKSPGGVRPDAVLQVRQTGSARQSGPTRFLAVGGRYLLFLTKSGLSGPLAQQFYVTGVDAGIYLLDQRGTLSNTTSAVQMTRNDGDHLPTSVTLGEVTANS